VNIWKLKVQRLKRNIEETREKLNILMYQNAPDITEEISDTSQKLDTLIKDYYCNLAKEKVQYGSPRLNKTLLYK
jgi:hypothetical protein